MTAGRYPTVWSCGASFNSRFQPSQSCRTLVIRLGSKPTILERASHPGGAEPEPELDRLSSASRRSKSRSAPIPHHPRNMERPKAATLETTDHNPALIAPARASSRVVPEGASIRSVFSACIARFWLLFEVTEFPAVCLCCAYTPRRAHQPKSPPVQLSDFARRIPRVQAESGPLWPLSANPKFFDLKP